MAGAGLALAAASLYFPVLFVAPLHLFGGGPRDDPGVLKRRLVAAATATALGAWVPTWLALQGRVGRTSSSAGAPGHLASALGLGTGATSPIGAARALGVALAPSVPVVLLHFGAASSTRGPGGVGVWLKGVVAARRERPLGALRDLVVAPVAEEVTFRAGFLSCALALGASRGTALLLAPFPFALAHIHHLAERVRHGGVPWPRALLQTAFQLSYTSAFAVYAARVFLDTRSLYACVLAHCVCNALGVPSFGRGSGGGAGEEGGRGRARAWCRRAAGAAGVALFLVTIGPATRAFGLARP